MRPRCPECGFQARSTTSAIRAVVLAPSTKRGAKRTRSSSPCRHGRAWDSQGTTRATPSRATFFEEIAVHRKKTNELVFVDCRYRRDARPPIARTHGRCPDADGCVRYLPTASGRSGADPAGGSAAGYDPHWAGRRKEWVRELRTSPPECRLPQNGGTAVRPSHRHPACADDEVWIDMLMDRQTDGAPWAADPLHRYPPDRHVHDEIAVDAEAVLLPGGSAVLRGTLRNISASRGPKARVASRCKSAPAWFRRSAQREAVREYRVLERLPTRKGTRSRSAWTTRRRVSSAR